MTWNRTHDNHDNIEGFTLIEVMVATVITMMIIGSVYAAFRSSLKVYQRDETRIIMLQRCRSALDRIVRDANNIFFVSGNEEMVLISEDYSDDEMGTDQDMISFVSIVEPRIEDYVPLEEADLISEEDNTLPSDLARIVYYLGPNPDDESVTSLMRIETSNLDIEELEEILDQVMSTSVSTEDMEEQGIISSALADYVSALNLRYFDGEEWIDMWDSEENEGLPKGLEITLTITDADTGEKTLTEGVVVYLPMSESVQEKEPEMAIGQGR
ncbi:hypothetical protein GF312_01730 [Candidatus Poribacteria bacterium]|nr:hypothetical protein [Candidatus Poribacteria bacterium]